MGLFKRKGRFLDLTKRYEKQQARAAPPGVPQNTWGKEMRQDARESSSSSENAGGLGFFGAIANTVSKSSNESSEYVDISSSVDEKKRKLAKRLLDMTTKIEDLSNQIYHLQQRLDVLERKSGVGSY